MHGLMLGKASVSCPKARAKDGSLKGLHAGSSLNDCRLQSNKETTREKGCMHPRLPTHPVSGNSFPFPCLAWAGCLVLISKGPRSWERDGGPEIQRDRLQLQRGGVIIENIRS